MSFIKYGVTKNDVACAKEIRAARDAIFGNIYEERETDARWVGDLGELVTDRWLNENAAPHDWFRERPINRPDFMICGRSIGVKTVKRKVSPRPTYTCQITGKHAQEPVEWFLFLSYETPRGIMWILGAQKRDAFIASARFHGPGAKVHENYTVRPGHSIYNGEISGLTTPGEWLHSLTAANV